MIKSVIFDVDGTLLDSSQGIKSAIQYTIKSQNLNQLKEDKLNEFVGFSPLLEAFKHFCQLDEDKAKVCCNIYRNFYKKETYKESKVYSGIFDLLTFLKDKGYKLGVATYKRQDYAINLMKHFGFDKYFDSICGADNENKLKKFDILVNCMNELNANKPTSLLIGDSYHDAEAAQKLGIDFIGVTYGFGFKSENEVTNYNSILVADSPGKILEYFQNTNSKISSI